jgi:hypothetical protein
MIKKHVSTRLVLLTLAGTTLAAAFAFGMRWAQPKAVPPATSAAPAPPTSQAAPNVAHLERDVADLRDANSRLGERSDEIVDILAELAARFGELEVRPGSEASVTAASGVTREDEEFDPEVERQNRARFEQSIQTDFDRLGENLQTEEVDASWSTIAQRDIEQAVHGMADRGLALNSARCGSTYCQIELAIDPELPEEEVFGAVRQFEPWTGPTFMSVGAGENAGATIYLAREGHVLPNFEPEGEDG